MHRQAGHPPTGKARLVLLGCLTALSVTSCGDREQLVARPEASAPGEIRSVFVGSTRAIDPATRLFTRDRGTLLALARYDISVPPRREPGRVSRPRPGEMGNPDRHFLVENARLYPDDRAFRSEIGSLLRHDPHGEAVVFVHGFNNTFADSLLRFAQLGADIDLPGVAVHYAWPSAGSPLAYARDRDSALLARDGLETLLRAIEAAGARRTIVVAHSMGAQLLMETLRQMAISAGSAGLPPQLAVILISPDIDVEVFRSQARRIGRLPHPFLIFASDRDRTLRLSAFITGEQARLGSQVDLDTLSDLDVTVIDVSAFSDAEPHFAPATSPLLLQMLGRVAEIDAALEDERARIGLVPGTVLTLQRATQVVLSPMAAIADQAR